MKLKKYLCLLLAVIVLAGMLTGCGGEMSSTAVGGNGAAMGDNLAKPEAGAGKDTVTPQNQKLIRKVWLNAETEDMDPLLAQVDARVAELGGYVESREVYLGKNSASYRNRYANLTIRIPAEKLDQFIKDVSENSNIVSTNESAEDITLSYVAVESRMKALETEQTRLLELLAQAKNMDEILQIESRLTSVRTELEEVTSQLRLFDNLVDYGTIYLNLSEVREYTVVEEEPEGFWERIGNGFAKSMKNLGIILREGLIFGVTVLPYMIPPAVILAIVLLITKLRKEKEKKTENPNDQGTA